MTDQMRAGRLLAVVFDGAAEREVNDRTEAIVWARTQGAKTVDLWTAPKPASHWRWLNPRIFDDGSKPIEFNVPVPLA
jgi:hypothetical protein